MTEYRHRGVTDFRGLLIRRRKEGVRAKSKKDRRALAWPSSCWLHRSKETGMTTNNFVRCLATAGALVLGLASVAGAEDPKVEIGTTMSTVTVGLGDNDGTIVGIPAGGFGLMNSGVYA